MNHSQRPQGGESDWDDQDDLPEFQPRLHRRRRWLRPLIATLSIFAVVFAGGLGALWWRLGEGPIGLDMATPWLASAIAENIGHDNSVEVGGTQIERVGPFRVAVRIRDIVVRDRHGAVVANAPKAEVRLSARAMLLGRLRAESLNLVDAELSVQIKPDGQVTVSTGGNALPIATGKAAQRGPIPPAADTRAPASAPADAAGDTAAPSSGAGADSLIAGLNWLDSLNLSGLDGQSLNEVGLKNGTLSVDDQQTGNRWSFSDISLSLRRPSDGGVAFKIGAAGAKPWSLGITVGPLASGVRAVDVKASKVSTRIILLAMRIKGLTYSADMPLTGELKGEIGRDGMPTYFRGRMVAEAGNIIDSETPEYPMHIDEAEVNVEWDAARRMLVAPFKVLAGENRVTLRAQLEAPTDQVRQWQLTLNGGTILFANVANNEPLIFNRINIAMRFDNERKRVVLTQADISNGEIGVAGTGSIDYAGDPRLTLGVAGTPMSVAALKRIWPAVIVPELREWVTERIETGRVQRVDIAVNSPLANMSRSGPPLPDEGLSVNIVGSGVTIRPVDGLPAVKDADLNVRVTGRTATVKVGQAAVNTPGGRKLALSEAVFEVPDLAPKPSPAKLRFKVDGPVQAAAEVLAMDRLKGMAGMPIDPTTSKGNVSARITLGMPIQSALNERDTTYSIVADLTGFSADKVVMNQKIESNNLKISANNQGLQVKGDIKIGGQPGTIDYRRNPGEDDDVRLQTVLDDSARARLGIDLGQSLVGPVPVKLAGRIGRSEHDSKFGIEMDLGPARIDNILPGWVKPAGKPGRATFNLVRKQQSNRLEDLIVDGGGTTIKGSLEVDDNGDLIVANFPTFSPSEGDKASLKADRVQDGSIKVVMRGDVFDGRNFLKSAVSGREASVKSKTKIQDFDLDLRLGVVAGYYGETLRGAEVKLGWRGGNVKSFTLRGKLGRDTALTGDLRGGAQGGREVIYVETEDAGAFFRLTDIYAKMVGGHLSLAMEPPVAEPIGREGLLNVRDFVIKGESQLDRVAGGNSGPAGRNGVGFSRMRAEFTRKGGVLSIREGVVKGPAVGATIEGTIDYPDNKVRMSGTFVPMYGLNNIFGQIPIVGLFLGGGSNEGLIGVTYEVVGSPGQPVLRVNPISAMAPGVLRKIFEFNTGRQNNVPEFPSARGGN